MVECTGLENRNTRKRIVGSNPTLSARSKRPQSGPFFFEHSGPRQRLWDWATGGMHTHCTIELDSRLQRRVV